MIPGTAELPVSWAAKTYALLVRGFPVLSCELTHPIIHQSASSFYLPGNEGLLLSQKSMFLLLLNRSEKDHRIRDSQTRANSSDTGPITPENLQVQGKPGHLGAKQCVFQSPREGGVVPYTLLSCALLL